MSHLYGTDGEDGVEMENFEVSDWDLQNEFNPHRQRHRQSKEEATYGVWAERDSDEERPSFGGKRYGQGKGAQVVPVVPGSGGRQGPGGGPFLRGAVPGCNRQTEQPSPGQGRPRGLRHSN